MTDQADPLRPKSESDTDNSISTSYEYDPIGRLKQQKHNGDVILDHQYDDRAYVTIAARSLHAAGDARLTVVNFHDDLGRVFRSASTSDTGVIPTASNFSGAIIVDSLYWPLDQGFSYQAVSNPYRSSGSSVHGWTRSKFDALGRLVEVAHFDGATKPKPWGTRLDTDAAITSTTYVANKATRRDPAGKVVATVTDGVGNIKEVTEGEGTGSAVTTYGYDVLGNLTSVVQGGRDRTFAYTTLGRLESATNPESGTTLYTYDDAGNLETRTDALGVKTTITYDKLNRPESRTYTGSPQTPPVTFSYDTCTKGRGRLCSVSSSAAAVAFSYTARGDVGERTQTTGGRTYPVTHTYNLAGSVQTISYQLPGRASKLLTYAYNDAGRVSTLYRGASGSPSPYAKDIEYWADGTEKSHTLTNDVIRETTLNGRLQISGHTLRKGTTTLWGLGLAYSTWSSNNGNVKTQTITQGASPSITQTYEYDAYNRLDSVVDSQLGTQDFAYDRWGNRALISGSYQAPGFPAEVVVSQASEVAARFPGNRLADGPAGTGPAHNAAGNLVRIASRDLTYDAEGRITRIHAPLSNSVEQWRYDYDGLGNRVRQLHLAGPNVDSLTVLDELHFLYDGGNQLLAEYAIQGNPIPVEGTQYVTTDWLGSTRVTTSPSGAVTSTRDYLPFGEEIRATNAGISLKFTGRERHDYANLRLDYFGARYFSGAQGRFTSPDEPLIDQAEDDPQSWNLYSYVRNNPLRFIDPSGQVCVSPGGGKPDYDDPSLPGPTCSEIKEQDKVLQPSVTVSPDWDQLRLMMLAGVGESLTSPRTWGSITRGAMENAYPLTSTIGECAASGFGGNCNSDSGVLYAAAAKPKLAQAAARIARLWTITRPAATKVIGGRTYLKDAKTKTWWSRDTAGHGGSAWKVYEERGGKLEWIADADAHGNFISGKHKSPIGTLLK